MSFADRAKNPPPKRDLCPIGNILDRLDTTEAAEFDRMLADRDHWPNTGANSIQQAIEAEGYGLIGDSIIRRHRGNSCRCPRP